MKPYSFAYTKAGSLDEALQLLASEEDPRILAGGQSLIPILNMRLAAPSRLIDINAIPEMSGLTDDGTSIRIGALARHSEVHDSALVREKLPLLAEAISYVAHPAIRNRGTFGGSICLADPAAEIPAVCVALEATIQVQGVGGARSISAREFFLDVFETALAEDEILVGVDLPAAQPDERFAFAELSRRHGDFAIAGIACRASVRDDVIGAIDPCFFGVCPSPTLAAGARAILEGSRGDPETVARAVGALCGDLEPQDDHQADGLTRLHLAGVLLKRAVARILNPAEDRT